MQVRILPRASRIQRGSHMDQYDREAIGTEEDNYHAFFGEMIRTGRLVDQPGLGVAKQWIGQGSSSLSEKQWYVVKGLIDEYVIEKCGQCSGTIPWSERYDARFLTGGLCSWCYNRKQKLDQE